MNNQRFDPEVNLLTHKLHTIFTYYCCFGDRDNFSTLKVQNYRRMLSDAQLLEQASDHPHLDLIYASNRSSQCGLTFEDFLSVLPEVVDFLDQDTMQNTINNNFHALYEYILENTDFGQCVTALQKQRFTEGCFILLREIASTIQKIYTYYFDPFKIQKNSDTFRQVTTFTRQFQITPQLITTTQSFIIYDFLHKQESTPVFKQWFTLQSGSNQHNVDYFKFVQYLILVSSLVGRKIYGVEMSAVKKLATFLEMLEISKGFNKLCKSEKIKLHLIASDALIKKIDQDPADTLQNITNRSSPVRRDLPNFNISAQFANNYQALKSKFINFCVQGQTVGNSHLTHKKTINIISDMNLGLKKNEIELLLAHTGGKPIDFQMFICLLEKIQQKEDINSSDLCELFLDLPLHQQFSADQIRTSRVQIHFTRDQYKKCLAMIDTVDLLFNLIFRLNCKPHKQSQNQLAFLSLTTYLKIMYDFQLSPLYLNKSCLLEIFKKSIKKSQDYMDLAEFKDSFIIALPYIQESNAQSLDQRMVLVLEQMNESRGVHKIAKKFPYEYKQDYLIHFRSIFHQNYRIQQEQVGKTQRRRKAAKRIP